MASLVILSAKIVSGDLKSQFGDIPSIMLPFEGYPVLRAQYNFFEKYYSTIYVVLEENFSIVEDYLMHEIMPKLKIIKVKGSKTIEDSLYSVSHLLISSTEPVSILYGDTYFSDLELDNELYNNFLVVSTVEDSSRWTIIKDGLIFDKKLLDNNFLYHAVAGFFNFIDASKFFESLLSYRFYELIQELLNKNEIKIIETSKWIDLGHEDNLIKTKKNLTRFFNEIKIDFKRGILTKFSHEKIKFRNEILWYKSLPTEVSYIAPRIFDSNHNTLKPYISMEYYAYDTLHEKYIHSNFSILKWEQIFDILFFNINELHKFKKKLPNYIINKNLFDMYINKPKLRIKELEENQPFFKTLFASSFVINSIQIDSINSIFTRLALIAKRLDIFKINDVSFIHGDYFLSNILYDTRNNFVRVVDPRGLFGNLKNYGDSRYDYAKLLHSLNGRYNLIVEDRFRIDSKVNSYTFKIFSNVSQDNALKAFYKVLTKYRINVFELKFIEITLFLSMLPLHMENLDRQKAMFFTGVLLLNELESELKSNDN